MDQLALSHLIQKHFPGSSLVAAWPLSGGISAQMTAIEIQAPGEQARKIILRCPSQAALGNNPAAARDEFRILQAARQAGLPVPTPLVLDESGQILPGAFLVEEYIEGRMDLAPADPVAAAGQMGEQLARIHAINPTRVGLDFLPRMDPASELERPVPSNTGLPVGAARAALAQRIPFPRDNPLTLLHGDFWPGNILWRDGRLAAVIDWEDACLGDPLADLAIARLEMLWIHGEEAAQALLNRYLAYAPLHTRALPLWDLFVAVRLARLGGADLEGWAAFFHPYGRTNITALTMRAALDGYVERALAALNGE